MVIIAGGVLVRGACCIPAVLGGRGQDRERGGSLYEVMTAIQAALLEVWSRHGAVLATLRPPLPSLRETGSAQPALFFRAKVCHGKVTKQWKPAQWSTCHGL